MSEKSNITRRKFITGTVASALLPVFPGLTLAATNTGSDKRFVMVIIRGAMDGLAAVPPFGDPALAGLRQSLLTNENSLYKLDSFFGLHPALESLAGMYADGDMSVYHAVATAYRERSHFDGQNVLETGMQSPDLGMSGWVNRSVPYIPGVSSSAVMGIGQTTPKILDGQYETTSWGPSVLPAASDSTLARLLRLYEQDTFLGDRFSQGLMAKRMAMGMETGGRRRGQDFSKLASAAGGFLSQSNGPTIAVLEISGWDTHANQGAQQGQLANKLGELDQGMAALKNSLGERWNNTMVLAMTEFGRTAGVNGTGGTDHGTASAAFLLGGAVQGGRVESSWPGLNPGSLYEGRDLAPTLDSGDLLAAILRQHLGISMDDIAADILPGYTGSGIIL